MLADLVLRNNTEMDFEISFQEKKQQGYKDANQTNYFLLAKNFRRFAVNTGIKIFKFSFLKGPSAEFFAEVISPGYYEVEFANDKKNILVKEKNVDEAMLNKLIATYFNEEKQFSYYIPESPRFSYLIESNPQAEGCCSSTPNNKNKSLNVMQSHYYNTYLNSLSTQADDPKKITSKDNKKYIY